MKEVIPVEAIANKIYLIRGHKVMLDADLAALYGVTTKRLNEQVRRNRERFPEDFMFRLSKEENENLKSQIATSSGFTDHGGRRTLPFVFTEHGANFGGHGPEQPTGSGDRHLCRSGLCAAP